jgi:hypothetical protein
VQRPPSATVREPSAAFAPRASGNEAKFRWSGWRKI